MLQKSQTFSIDVKKVAQEVNQMVLSGYLKPAHHESWKAAIAEDQAKNDNRYPLFSTAGASMTICLFFRCEVCAKIADEKARHPISKHNSKVVNNEHRNYCNKLKRLWQKHLDEVDNKVDVQSESFYCWARASKTSSCLLPNRFWPCA